MGYPNTHMRAALFGAIVFASGPGLAGGGGDNLPPVFSLTGAPGQGGTTTASYTPGLGRSSSTASETVKVVGPGFDAAVTVDADASANNHLIGRSTSAVTGGYGGVAGNGSVSVTNTNVAESFLKGSNGISESESTVYVTVTVNGRSYVVAEEVAIALARSTQFGSSTAAYSNSGVNPLGGGYSSTQVIASKGSR
ncbi:MAG: hypothetical protein ACLPPF_15460 [Rhodomicrobium sp.]